MILPFLLRLGALRFSSDAPDVPPPPPQEKPPEVPERRPKGRRRTVLSQAPGRPEAPLGGDRPSLGNQLGPEGLRRALGPFFA